MNKHYMINVNICKNSDELSIFFCAILIEVSLICTRTRAGTMQY